MNLALWRKCVREGAVLFAACGIAILIFSWFRVWIVGELDTSRFRAIIELLPDDWRRYTPVDFEWLISYLGRTALTLDEPLLIMLLAIWAIVRGSDVVSGEVSRGTMEMILAQPVGRRKVFLIQSAVTVLGVVLLCLICWFGMWLGIQTTAVTESTFPELKIPFTKIVYPLTFLEPNVATVPMGQRVDAIAFAPGIVNLLLLGFFLAGVSAFVSSWDRYRWRTLGIVVGFYVVSAMLKILGMASETFGWVMWITFFTCYEPESMIQISEAEPKLFWNLLSYSDEGYVSGFGPMANNLFFLATGLLCFAAGLAIFRRRDLPAPV